LEICSCLLLYLTFHTDKIQQNIDFLVKFGLGVWPMNIDCKPLSFFFRALGRKDKRKKMFTYCI
jgi:hypothetical protein